MYTTQRHTAHGKPAILLLAVTGLYLISIVPLIKHRDTRGSIRADFHQFQDVCSVPGASRSIGIIKAAHEEQSNRMTDVDLVKASVNLFGYSDSVFSFTIWNNDVAFDSRKLLFTRSCLWVFAFP